MAIIKSLAAPKTWPIERKKHKFVIRPYPGKVFSAALPISVILRLLGFANTRKEAKYVLNNKDVYVNNRRIKEEKFPVGLMDVIQFPIIEKYYRLVINSKKKLYLKDIKKDESHILPLKVVGKKLMKGSRWQINLSNSYNLLVEESLIKDVKSCDSVVLDLNQKNKIIDIIKFEKNNYAYIIGGRNVGHVGRIVNINKQGIVEIESKEGIFKTNKKDIYMVGKEKPLITL